MNWRSTRKTTKENRKKIGWRKIDSVARISDSSGAFRIAANWPKPPELGILQLADQMTSQMNWADELMGKSLLSATSFADKIIGKQFGIGAITQIAELDKLAKAQIGISSFVTNAALDELARSKSGLASFVNSAAMDTMLKGISQSNFTFRIMEESILHDKMFRKAIAPGLFANLDTAILKRENDWQSVLTAVNGITRMAGKSLVK
jgi:hypothetical protein